MFNSVCNELKIPLRSAHLVWVYKWHIIDLFFFFFLNVLVAQLFPPATCLLHLHFPCRECHRELTCLIVFFWRLYFQFYDLYGSLIIQSITDKWMIKKTLHSSLLIKSFHLHFYDVGFPSDQMFSKHTNCYLSVFLMKVMSTLY